MLILALAGTSCRPDEDRHAAGPAHEKHWGYEDGAETVGPEKWGALPGDSACAQGTLQSPIALQSSGEAAAVSRDLPNLEFHYAPSPLRLANNGHTVQFDEEGAGTLTDDGTSFRLAQFHFHSPSEHTLDGHHFPLEIHLVHVDASGRPALVVGVFVQEGKANAALAKAFEDLPRELGGRKEPPGATINASELLPADRRDFRYPGSLTTPPCTEGIRWHVLREPIEMSPEQIRAYRALPHLDHSERPLQPVGSREVALDASP